LLDSLLQEIMTIVTKPLTGGEKKDVKESKANSDPLVQVEDDTNHDVNQGDDEPDLNLTYNTLNTRVRRLSRATHICLVLTLTLATMLGMMAALHLYRSVFVKSRNYCGTYRVPLKHGVPHDTLVAANFQNPKDEMDMFKLKMFALFNHEPPVIEDPDNFEFDVELDVENNMFEELQLPEIFMGRYMHDFKVNHTVIIDRIGQKCFLMGLDRINIPPPQDIFDVLMRMRQGDFDIDYEEIRKTYRIAGPPIAQFDESHGTFIPRHCSDMPTYRLEEIVGDVVVKREVATSGEKYGEYVTTKLIKYHILNME